MNSLASRIRDCARLRGEFVLRSGVTSDTYFDKYQFEADPVLLRDIAEQLAALVPADTEILAGLEMGGIPVVTVLSQVTAIPAAFLRKQPKSYGTNRYAEGPELTGKRVLLVEDVVSSGGAIIDTLVRLRGDGVDPVGALCVIDRQSGGVQALAGFGLALTALYTMDEIENA